MNTKQKIILITGGAGYIGSHAVVAFEQAGYTTISIDNLSNSSLDAVSGINKILGYTPIFHECDITQGDALREIFRLYSFDAVIHFASYKAIGESCKNPFSYYENNFGGTVALFRVMQEFGVTNCIFSSSASIYAASNPLPWKESGMLHATHPYGNIKIAIEYLLGDLAKYHNWKVIALRYFNPIGAHSSGYIGENPQGIPNNLLPYILDVAIGKREYLGIFGGDYDTADGTCIRDYIDINDLVEAHLLAYQKLDAMAPSIESINIGAGSGTSVLKIVAIARDITGKEIPVQVLPRRDGDLPEFFADVSLSEKVLNWKPQRTIADSIQTDWNYMVSEQIQLKNKPLVSIILPSYNPKKEWIEASIRSVLVQTYAHFELIIIDDASNNGVFAQISDLIQSDPRIRVVRNKKNLRLVHSLNRGIQESKGTYIARLDDDDIWSDPSKLQKQVDFMENNETYGICGTGLQTMDQESHPLESIMVRLSDTEIRKNLLKDSQFAHASVLIRKEALDAVGLYDPTWNLVEDYDLWLRIGKKYRLSNLPGNLLLYRINPNGVSNKNFFRQKWMGLLLTWRYRNDYPGFYTAMMLKIPYMILPKKVSQCILRIIKK